MPAHFGKIPVAFSRDICYKMFSLRVKLDDRRHGTHGFSPWIAASGHHEYKCFCQSIIKAHTISMQLAVGAASEITVNRKSSFKCLHGVYFTIFRLVRVGESATQGKGGSVMEMTRREFVKGGLAALGYLALDGLPVFAAPLEGETPPTFFNAKIEEE